MNPNLLGQPEKPEEPENSDLAELAALEQKHLKAQPTQRQNKRRLVPTQVLKKLNNPVAPPVMPSPQNQAASVDDELAFLDQMEAMHKQQTALKPTAVEPSSASQSVTNPL